MNFTRNSDGATVDAVQLQHALAGHDQMPGRHLGAKGDWLVTGDGQTFVTNEDFHRDYVGPLSEPKPTGLASGETVKAKGKKHE